MYQLSLYKIVEAAIDKLRLRPYGQDVTAEQLKRGKRAFNLIVQNWAEHIEFQWMEEELRQKCSAGSIVTNDSIVYTCRLAHTAAAINEPGTGADWEQFWYTGGNSDLAVAWVDTTAYTSGKYYDLALLDEDIIQVNNVRVLYNEEFYEVDFVDTREEFENLYCTYDTGKAKKAWVDYQNTQNDGSLKVHIYPFPENSTDYVLYFSVLKKLPAFSSNSEYPGVPAKWVLPLIYSMASDLAPEFDIPDKYASKALSYYQEAIRNADRETIIIVKDGAFE